MKKKYARGGRSGKLHNIAMRMRKNKPQKYNPLKEKLLKAQLMEQMKLFAEQTKNNSSVDLELTDKEIEQEIAKDLLGDKNEQ